MSDPLELASVLSTLRPGESVCFSPAPRGGLTISIGLAGKGQVFEGVSEPTNRELAEKIAGYFASLREGR